MDGRRIPRSLGERKQKYIISRSIKEESRKRSGLSTSITEDCANESGTGVYTPFWSHRLEVQEALRYAQHNTTAVKVE